MKYYLSIMWNSNFSAQGVLLDHGPHLFRTYCLCLMGTKWLQSWQIYWKIYLDFPENMCWIFMWTQITHQNNSISTQLTTCLLVFIKNNTHTHIHQKKRKVYTHTHTHEGRKEATKVLQRQSACLAWGPRFNLALPPNKIRPLPNSQKTTSESFTQTFLTSHFQTSMKHNSWGETQNF